MSSSSDIKAGRAYVEIGTKNDPLDKGLAAAQRSLRAFGGIVSGIGTKFAAIGAAITAPLLLAAHSAAESGEAIYLMSKRTGLSVEALSRLGFAAQLTGIDIDTVEGAIRRMQKTISGVKDDLEGTTGELGHLGLEAAKIKKLKPEEQFNLIAEKIGNIADPTARAAAAMKVFGKTGTVLLPMIEEAGKLREVQEQLGLVKSTKSAKEQHELAQAFTLAGMAAKSVSTALASAVLPILKQKTETMIRLTISVRNFIKENQPFVAIVFKVATAVGIAGAGMFIFGKAIGYAAAAFGPLRAVAGLTASLIGGTLSTAFRTLRIAVLAPYAAINLLTGAFRGLRAAPLALLGVLRTLGVALLGVASSPLLLLTVSLLAVGGAFLVFSGAGGKAVEYLKGKFTQLATVGGQALAWLRGKFEVLKADALTAFGGIADALKAGDIKLAAQIMWAFLKLEFARGAAQLATIWTSVKTTALTIWFDTVEGITSMWAELKMYLSSWDGVMAGITKIAAGIRNVFESVINYVADLLQDTFMETSNKALEKALAKVDEAQNGRKLTPDQANQARKAAHDTFDNYDQKQRNARDEQRRKAYEDKLAAADAAFKAANPQAVKDKEDAIARAKALRDAAVAAAQKGSTNPDIKKQEEDIARLQRELQALRGQAKAKRTAAEGGGEDGGFDPTGTVKALGDAKVHGTFFAGSLAAQSLGADTQSLLKESNGHLKRIEQKTGPLRVT